MSGAGGYGRDLAYVHHTAFSGYALGAAPGLLRALRRHGVGRGLVVDLGCGGGAWARELTAAGYDVFGVDQSPEFIRLARRTAPKAHFAAGSLYRVSLPACDAVTAVGECVNYAFDAGPGRAALPRLLARAHRALRPGGVLIFDVAGPRRVPGAGARQRWFQGGDWALLVETHGDRRRALLTRRITCFRKVGALFRKSDEVHRLRLYEPSGVLGMLRRAGFKAERMPSYGRFPLPKGIAAFLARK